MGFIEAVGITEAVNYAAEIEGVREVSTEAEMVKKAEGFINVAVFGAEVMDFLGPV